MPCGFSRAEIRIFLVHRPTGARLFQREAIAVPAKVVDFGFAGNAAVVDAVLASEPTADAIAESDVEDGVETYTSAEEGFCKAGNFDVVRCLILACVIETKAKGRPIHPATKTHPNKKPSSIPPDGLYLSSQQTQTNDYLIRRGSPGFSSDS